MSNFKEDLYTVSINGPGLMVEIEVSSKDNLSMIERIVMELRFKMFPYVAPEPEPEQEQPSDKEVILDPVYSRAEIEQIAKDWTNDLHACDDGELVLMREQYRTFAGIRRNGELIPVRFMSEPKRSYPAEVWDWCIQHVNDEIQRRTALVQEGGADD